MPSKVLDEFLKKASPETQAALQQTRQDLQKEGVQLGQSQQQPPRSPMTTSAPGERAAVQQIGQDLQQNGAQIQPDPYGPQTPARIGESRPHAAPPTFMDEQKQASQQPAAGEKADLQQTRQGLQWDGIQASNQAPAPKRENAVDRALSSTGNPPAQSQEKQKSQELER